MRERKVYRLVWGVLVFLVAPFWQLITWRVVGCILLLAVVGLYFRMLRTNHRRAFLCAFTLFAITPFLPWDLSFRTVPSGPRFVRLVMGLPTSEAFEKARRGDIVLGGCVVNGFEPRWVWAW